METWFTTVRLLYRFIRSFVTILVFNQNNLGKNTGTYLFAGPMQQVLQNKNKRVYSFSAFKIALCRLCLQDINEQ
jgi:hypothetical protein